MTQAIVLNSSLSYERILHTSEIFPVVALGINSFLGCLLNLIAGLAYLRKDKAFQNPGNLFTVSLLAGDLAFSGITIPLIVYAETLYERSWSALKCNMCLATRCAVNFASVFNAIGNTLLAFDRFDLTHRPSNRLFRPKGTLFIILMSWLISALNLVVPLLSVNQMSQTTNNKAILLKIDDVIKSEKNKSSLETLGLYPCSNYTSNHSEIICSGSCHQTPSSFIYPVSETQVYLQSIVFALATLIMALIYFQILHSLQKRTYGQGKQEKPSKKLIVSWKIKSCMRRVFCCFAFSNTFSTSIESQSNTSDADNQLPPVSVVPKIDSPMIKKKVLQVKETTHLCVGITKETHKQSKVETKAYDSCNKADFATVAFSVKAFVTLKKAVRERRKLKQKKLRQLRRMSIAIAVAFALSWLPFHMFSIINLLKNSSLERDSYCQVVSCSNYSLQSTIAVPTTSKSGTPNEIFLNTIYLWCLVFASFSSITDALLYTFSRENIRRDLKKSYNRVMKSNHSFEGNIARRKSLRLLTKTTEFMSPNISRRDIAKNNNDKYAQLGSPLEETAPVISGKKTAILVPLKDPDSPSAMLNANQSNHFSRQQSIASCISSNKSTLESSFISTKSVNYSLDS